MRWYTITIAIIIVLTNTYSIQCGENMDKGAIILAIEWQRLVDAKGKTCDRCRETEKELDRAVASLKRSLHPLGIKVMLEKKSLEIEHEKDIIKSNQILIADRPLEEWLGAQVGTSACGSCCENLHAQVECRTTSFDGKTYEAIPANLIVKAGLKAAAEIIDAPSSKPCCSQNDSSTEKVTRKRVVTGHDPDGKAVFISTGAPPRIITSKNGGEVTYCWATFGPPAIPFRGGDPTLDMITHYPGVDSTTCVIVQFPGNFQGKMHATNSVDYVFVLSGELWLVLDSGAEVRLNPGDCVVQNGTRHAWHNRKSEPCVIAGALIGVKR